MGIAAEIVPGRAARQLRAIGNYWRICQYLARASRTHQRAFETLELHTVRFGSKKDIVHAEVQLLLFHETSKDIVRPEIMPASKKTCFLCHTFFESFGQYALVETHGQVPQRWSLPDDERLDARLRVKLNQALKRTSSVVQGPLKKGKKKKIQSNPMGGPLNPAQSVVSSILDELRTPSISTIRPEASVIEIISMARGKDVAAEICAPPSIDSEFRSHKSFEKTVSREARTAEVLDCVEESAYCTTPRSLLECVGAEKASAQKIKARRDSVAPFNTSSQQLVHGERAISQLDLDWLSLYVTEASLQANEPTTRLCNAICRPVPVSARPDIIITVDVTGLTSQDGLTIEKPTGAEYFDIRMRLEGHEDVYVRLEWTE
ncbi:Hypothetical predicted protein [Lecanosticta acicola]|uniref:Uncharacterized protein n=1 Tax=Lecanosticta acicola TaxID=111012 RepID=A0AAI8Z212_9PEZI|nr:Hypothetical predicted protein [Lecanosticta acicola]